MNKKIVLILSSLALVGSLSACASETEITEVIEVVEVDTNTTVENTSVKIVETTTDQFTDRDLDPTYDSSEAINISLINDGTVSEVDSVTVESNIVTINQEGIYVFTGSLNDGQIVVDTDSESKVQIVLNNVSITNSNLAAVYVKQADKVFITVIDGTTSSLTTSSDISEDGETNVDAVIFSKDDLVINGSGTLEILSSDNGIVSKDDLKLVDVNLIINADSHGLEANDSVRVSDAILNITANEDGFSVGNDDSGYIYVESGNIDILAGDDGMHAISSITVDGGIITIIESNEGIESAIITINAGYIDITSSDDGFNATSDNSDDVLLEINGGEIFINASGDGLDSNGDLTINGGSTYVIQNGGANGAIDYNGTGVITGGSLIAVGSSDRLQGLDSTTQGTILTTVTNDETVTLTDSDNNEIINLATDSSYQAIFISNENIELYQTYILTTGSTSLNVEMTTLNYRNGISEITDDKKGH
jgi:hypothetical protein